MHSLESWKLAKVIDKRLAIIQLNMYKKVPKCPETYALIQIYAKLCNFNFHTQNVDTLQIIYQVVYKIRLKHTVLYF